MNKKGDKSKWIWMPHPGHFICARDCRFHLNTYVGNWIVSTVGEYLPDSPVRDILATSRGIELKGRGDERLADYMKKIGYEDLGYDRKYETMVFPAELIAADKCCPYRVIDFHEVDFIGYNDSAVAFKGHMELCEKWAKQPRSEEKKDE